MSNTLTSTKLSSSLGGEFGPLVLDGSYTWAEKSNGVDVPIENPKEKSFTIFGYDFFNGNTSPNHKTSENITIKDGKLVLKSDTSPIVPTKSSVIDSFDSVGAHAYLLNINVHNTF